MSTTYPSMLPRPMLSGYGLKVTSANTSTDLDRGSSRRRRAATKSKTVLDFSIALTDAQYAIFAGWWRYDLNDGTLPAIMKILNGYADHPTTVQFLKPYSATDQLGKWYISCQVEVEPFRLSEAELDAMISGGTIYTLPPEVPGGPGIFPFYGYLRITQQPVSQSVLQPDSATFTIAAVGTGTLSYQWKKNGVNVGTNSTTYNTGSTTWTGVDDVITCVVSNGVASVTSDNATLNVRKASISQVSPGLPSYGNGSGGVMDGGIATVLLGNGSSNQTYQGTPGSQWTNSGVSQASINPNQNYNSCVAITSQYMYVMLWYVHRPFLNIFNRSTKTWGTPITLDSYYVNANYNRYAVCVDGNDIIVLWQHIYSGDSCNKFQLLKYSGGTWTLLRDYGNASTPSIHGMSHSGTGFFIRIGNYYYLAANTRRTAPANTVRIYRIDVSSYDITDTEIPCGGGGQGILINGKIVFAGQYGTQHYYMYDGTTVIDLGPVGSQTAQDASNGQFFADNNVVYVSRFSNVAIDSINL